VIKETFQGRDRMPSRPFLSIVTARLHGEPIPWMLSISRSAGRGCLHEFFHAMLLEPDIQPMQQNCWINTI